MTESEAPMAPDGDESRFAEQVLRALDGQLGPEEDEDLRSSLAADAARRRLFVQLCLQTQSLLEIFGTQRHVQLPVVPDDERSRRGRRPWFPWAIAAAACLLR